MLHGESSKPRVYLEAINIVGKLTPAAGGFRSLCVDDDGVRSIGLKPRLPKCGIYGGDKELVAAKAAKLQIAHQLDCFTAVGSPLGLAAPPRHTDDREHPQPSQTNANRRNSQTKHQAP